MTPAASTIAVVSWRLKMAESSPSPCRSWTGVVLLQPAQLGPVRRQEERPALGVAAVDPSAGDDGADVVDAAEHLPHHGRGRAGPVGALEASGSGAAWSPTHQPPLRPDAPNPAVSRSSTTTRSVGVAAQQVVRASTEPVNPAPTMATSTSVSPGSAGRGTRSSPGSSESCQYDSGAIPPEKRRDVSFDVAT